jgi:DNA-binding transcriptional LysR family regulator
VLNEIIEHDVVGDDVNDQIIRGFLNYGIRIDRKFFAFRSDNQLVAWELVRAGLGIGFMPVKIADADSLAKRLLPDQKLPVLPVWLTAHSELRTSARIRYVYDYLVKRLEKKLSRTSSGKPV